jgi:hypothetical protein
MAGMSEAYVCRESWNSQGKNFQAIVELFYDGELEDDYVNCRDLTQQAALMVMF